jgi:uracil-DNA glycosylase family 4
MNYDANCNRCDRLNDFLSVSKKKYPDYFCKPVPAFGDKNIKLLIVGLAPGLHGANKTGRPFTGDHAGIILYETLFKHGFSNKPNSKEIGDGLELHNCRITNAVKCLPPLNKPTTQEIKNCNQFLKCEIELLKPKTILLALGTVAHNAILSALRLTKKNFSFAHATRHELPNDLILYDSYHCSRYNTQTKRLTTEMFNQVFLLIKKEMEE